MKKLASSLRQTAMISVSWWVLSLHAAAMTPVELQKKLGDGTRITVIDIRSTASFQKGHIPGAINIPASLIPEKNLPPLGKVIVYDEGLGQANAAGTAAELNRKKGITAEVLEGGFAGWEALQGTTTREPGMQREELNLITYDQLKKADQADLVFVDLRKAAAQERQNDPGTDAQPPRPVTDLQKEFPKVRVTRSPFDLPQVQQSGSKDRAVGPLLVLIDNGGGDAAAQEMARTLKANGMRRVVILTGGEEILSRGGKPGLQRTGVVVGPAQKK